MSTEPYAELAELAGSFIHEIKNHLSTLGLNLQLLAEDFQQPQSQRERRALERISRLQAESQRLVDVANDFLRFARVKDLELAPVPLTRFHVRSERAQGGVTVRLSPDDPASPARCPLAFRASPAMFACERPFDSEA